MLLWDAIMLRSLKKVMSTTTHFSLLTTKLLTLSLLRKILLLRLKLNNNWLLLLFRNILRSLLNLTSLLIFYLYFLFFSVLFFLIVKRWLNNQFCQIFIEFLILHLNFVNYFFFHLLNLLFLMFFNLWLWYFLKILKNFFNKKIKLKKKINIKFKKAKLTEFIVITIKIILSILFQFLLIIATKLKQFLFISHFAINFEFTQSACFFLQ